VLLSGSTCPSSAMDAPQIFLSYNREDREAVIAVRNLLRGRGVTTFLDRDNLVAGVPWPLALERALSGARAVLVFIGRQLGGWEKREMWFALDRQVSEEKQGRPFPVVPVLLPGADVTPGFLFSNTWVDLRNGHDSLDAAEALDGIERAIDATMLVPARAKVPEFAALCPYRGLESFREEDSVFFAGRAAFSRKLFGFTLDKDLVAVVGPSGSGKSSVVHAGLAPLLRRERPPAKTWDVVSFTPGSDPFRRLASALIPLLVRDVGETDRLAEAQKLGDRLAHFETTVGAVIDRIIEKSNGLVADQFEELFTVAPESGRRPFAQALLQALGTAPFTLLLTLRADFYGQIITLDRELSDRIACAQVNIGTLTEDELRDSITEPARLVGLDIEPGLADRILSDARCEPGSLPLVEFSLTELCLRRREKKLTNAAYNEFGGVTGALAKRAEAEFAKFTHEERTATRQLFSRLVRVADPGAGTEDTRQRLELAATDAVTQRVARWLSRRELRLLVTGRDDQSGIQTVEVAHEALIRNWERLRGWLNEDREFLLWRQRLQAALEGYERGQGDAGSLLRGAPLAEAERWLATRAQDFAEAERRFVGESVALREREAVENERRRRGEIAKAQQLKELAEARAEAEKLRAAEQATHAGDQARHARRVLRFAWGLGLLLLLALAEAGYVLWARAVDRARELVIASSAAENADPEISVLIAAQAVISASKWTPAMLPEAEDRLHRAIVASHVKLTLRGHSDNINSVAWNSDGRRLATGSSDNTVRVWDAETGKVLLTLRGHDESVRSVAWSPDGKRLATGNAGHTAKVWDPETGKELLTLRGHDRSVETVAWSPDGKRLVTGSLDHTAKVWEAETAKELLTLRGDVATVVWSPDSKRLATVTEDTAAVLDAGTGKKLLTLTGHRDFVFSVAWSPDGKRLATGSVDKSAKVWDAGTGSELLTLNGHGDSVLNVAWSPDGKRLATGSRDDTAKVWDVNAGEVLTLSGHGGAVLALDWSRDGKHLATGSLDHTAKVWDAQTGKELLTLGHGDNVFSVAWSPDGKRLATGSADCSARVWDTETGKDLVTMRSDYYVWKVAWSPDGKRLTMDNSLRDSETGKELLVFRGSGVWSPDGKRLAGTRARPKVSPDEAKSTEVWDAETGKELLTLRGHSAAVESVAWSPDGKRLATGSGDRTAKIWDAEAGKDLRTLGAYNLPVNSVAWSPDGRRVAMGNADGTIQVDYAIDLMKLARERVTAHPSEQGCRKYLHVDKCPPVPEPTRW
jgi:WD40 repeat protein